METSSYKNNDMTNKIVAKYISGKVGKSDSFHLNIKRVNIFFLTVKLSAGPFRNPPPPFPLLPADLNRVNANYSAWPSICHRYALNMFYFYSDMDECSSFNDLCHVHAICQNTILSFTCNCKEGFTGDGFDCFGK